jgi:hypothetical protein
MTWRTARVPAGSSVLVVLSLGVAALPAAGQGVEISQPVDRGCLACMATRQATAAEWAEALALTATMKASPQTVRAPLPAEPGAPPDPRSAIDRMRDAADHAYGADLAHLGSLAARIDRDAETYLSYCYDRYATSLGVAAAAAPAGWLARAVPPPQTEAGRLDARRAPAPVSSDFEQSSGTPVQPWSETWRPLGITGGESLVPCDGMWRNIHAGGTAVKKALDQIEADARANNVYPGVVRELFDAYGVNRLTR